MKKWIIAVTFIILAACSTSRSDKKVTWVQEEHNEETAAKVRSTAKERRAHGKHENKHGEGKEDKGHAGEVHWTYSGKGGPASWGKLSPAFSACSSGKHQSPIDVANGIEADLRAIEINYHVGGKEIINNGHTVQVNYEPGSNIVVDEREFELKQYHFHAPSEHTIKGKSYPLEVHFVHADKKGNLAVIGVMFEEGRANESLAQAWKYLPKKEGESHDLEPAISVETLLPGLNREYYRYSGSLTTPPCSEGVRWFVLKQPVTASSAQIEKFSHALHEPNNRPVQDVNARVVLQ